MHDELVNLSRLNLDLSDEQNLLLGQVDRVCRQLRPSEETAYTNHKFNNQVPALFGKAHLLGLPISPKYGDGQGVDASTYAMALERIGEEGTGVRTFFSGHVSLGQLAIQRWGTEQQKAAYLVPASKGDKVFAFGLTEPEAGSDPSALRTSFTENGGRYVINGQKTWISNGSIADAVVVFAYPKGRAEGMCAFIVDKKSEGFSAAPIRNKMGLFSSDTATIHLDGCLVPKGNMLGPTGKGLSVAYSALMNGRISVAAGCVGVARDCLREAVRYSKMRIQHKKLIGKHQLVQRHIGVMATNLDAAHMLVLQASYLKQKYDEGPNNEELRDIADATIAKAKYFAARTAFDTADRALQVFGANGYSMENRPARHLVDTRACRIYEGTEEILEQKIAISVLGKGFEAYS